MRGKQRRGFPEIIVSAMIVTVLLFTAVESARGGEHRYRDEIGLPPPSSTSHHTPQWYQRFIDNYHPVGCGPTAWAILYAYWYESKGKKRLFSSTPDYRGGRNQGSTSQQVADVESEVAYETETSYGQSGGGTWGRTWSSNFCQGIEYARKRGYTKSRCLRITGTEFNKYNHVKRYLADGKPVVLNINHEGFGIYDHYVIVERARIKQEKINGKWRDRDVEYYVNFGWGEDEPGQDKTKWISVRQRGRNTGNVYTSGAAFLIDISAVPLPEAADANEAACKDWCRSAQGRQQGCRMCSHLAGCGPGYRPVRSWKKAAKNWYACAKKGTKRSDASEENRTACENWCRQHRSDKGCLKCDTRKDCGPDYRNLKTWKGYGTNWHACRKKGQSHRQQESGRHHQKCQQWCDANKPDCVYCSKSAGCGSGFQSLKTWKGYGVNWHACGKNRYGRNSEKNEEACIKWCKAHRPPCKKCLSKKGCGKGFTSMKTFGGKGENWFACRPASSQSNRDACEIWCNQHKPQCHHCSSKSGCGRHYKKIESFRGRGKNWFACEKR